MYNGALPLARPLADQPADPRPAGQTRGLAGYAGPSMSAPADQPAPPLPPPPPPSPPSGSGPSVGPLSRAVRAVSGMTLLSRLGGLVRDVLVGRIFGDTAVNSAFAAAFAIPNMFRRLFGEGALSAAFIPAYTQAQREDRATAAQLASMTLAVLGAVTSGLVVVAELALLAVLLLAPPDPERDLSLRLIMVMLPFMPLICMAAILSGMLQVHGRFAAASSGPLVLNAFIIVVGVVCLFTGQRAGETVAYAFGVATVLSGFTQAFWFWRLLRKQVAFTRAWSAARERGGAMLRKFVPVAIGLGTVQLNAFLDMLIAMYPLWVGATIFGVAYPIDAQGNGILSLTQRLYQFPLGVFGIAVATAVFPLLAKQANDPAHFASTLRRGLRLSLFIGLPASVGLVLVRYDLTSVLFEDFSKAARTSGEAVTGFTTQGAHRAAAVLLGFAPGVWAYSLNHVLTRAFYARGNTATPMRVAVVVVCVNLVLNCTLIWWFAEAGLAWGTSLAAMVQCGILAWLLERDLRRSGGGTAHITDGQTLGAMARVALAAGVMALAVGTLLWFWPQPPTWSGRAARLAGAAGLGMASYLGLALALRLHELRWLLHREKGGPAPGGVDTEG